VLQANAKEFPEIELFSIKKLGASWEEADVKFFGDGGLFDSVYEQQ
jgi:ABC-type sulfate transport system substrate-binding protein